MCILIKIPIFFIGQKHTQQIHLVGKRWGRNQQSPYINAWVKQQYWRHLVEYLLWSAASPYDSPKGIFHFILSKKGAFNNYTDQNFSTLPSIRFLPPLPSNGQKWTFYLLPFVTWPPLPLLVHVVIECPLILQEPISLSTFHCTELKFSGQEFVKNGKVKLWLCHLLYFEIDNFWMED